MLNSEPASSGLGSTLRKLLDTGLAAVQNRAELLAVEFREEKDSAIALGLWVVLALFFALMTLLVLTATIVLIFPDDLRVYATAGLTLLYLIGALWAFSGVKKRLKDRNIPFA